MSSLSLRLVAIAAGVTAAASTLAAQNTTRPSFGVFGGAAFPTGDFGDDFDTGYNVGGFIGIAPATLPVGLRFDGMYNRFDLKSGRNGDGAHLNIFAGTANVVLRRASAPGMVRPYLIGGLGIYNLGGGGDDSDSETKFGLNGGAGLDIALSGISVFAEARYNYVFTKNDETPGSSNLGFVPVVVGVRF